jgi:hypothetical protein
VLARYRARPALNPTSQHGFGEEADVTVMTVCRELRRCAADGRLRAAVTFDAGA